MPMLSKLVRVSWRYVAWNKIIITITCIQHHYGIFVVMENQFHVSLGFFFLFNRLFYEKSATSSSIHSSYCSKSNDYSASFLEQGSPDSVKTARTAWLQHNAPPGPLCWPRLQHGLNYSSHTVTLFACKEQNLCEVILCSTQGLDEQQALKVCVHSTWAFLRACQGQQCGTFKGGFLHWKDCCLLLVAFWLKLKLRETSQKEVMIIAMENCEIQQLLRLMQLF